MDSLLKAVTGTQGPKSRLGCRQAAAEMALAWVRGTQELKSKLGCRQAFGEYLQSWGAGFF